MDKSEIQSDISDNMTKQEAITFLSVFITSIVNVKFNIFNINLLISKFFVLSMFAKSSVYVSLVSECCSRSSSFISSILISMNNDIEIESDNEFYNITND